jgi:ketosteroid isomerase-like protein
MLKKLMFASVAVLAMTACAPAPTPAPAPPPDTSADQASLKSDLSKWFDDFNAGKIDDVTSQYAADAILMPPDTPASNGSGAIKTALGAMSADMKKAGLSLNGTGTPSVGVSGDMAWIQGTYNVTDTKGTAVEVGKFLSVHRKTNGKWLYIRDTWNSDAPPPPAPPPGPAPKKK